jgi:hypothetical protein
MKREEGRRERVDGKAAGDYSFISPAGHLALFFLA